MKTLSLLLLLLAFTNAFSQDIDDSFSHTRKTRILINLGYNTGIGSIRIKDDVAVPNEGYVARLRVGVSHLITPHVMVAVEAGLDGYHNPNFNLFPVSASGYYFLKPEKKSLFVRGDLGYSIKLSDPFKAGTIVGAALGYRIRPLNKTSVLVSIGPNFHYIKDAKTYLYNANTSTVELVKSSFWLQSLSFGAVVLF